MKTFSQLEHATQLSVFWKVFGLKKQGLGYKKIRKKIMAEDEVRLSNGTMFYWFNNDVKMIGGENSFEAKPSPELSYVLGVMFGDGSACVDVKNQDYSLKLQAKDKDFVEKFSQCGAKVLGKEKSYAVIRSIPKHFSPLYSTQIRSKQLYNFVKEIKNDFEKARPFIEEFPAEFVRGLADSEGTASVSVGKASLYLQIHVAVSTNFQLLNYVKDLLSRKFEIESKLDKVHFAGQTDSVINGRLITRTKDVYRLTIPRKNAMLKFSELIGFAIWRKQVKIKDYRYLSENFNGFGVDLWKKLYMQKNRFWVRRTQGQINDLKLIN